MKGLFPSIMLSNLCNEIPFYCVISLQRIKKVYSRCILMHNSATNGQVETFRHAKNNQTIFCYICCAKFTDN